MNNWTKCSDKLPDNYGLSYGSPKEYLICIRILDQKEILSVTSAFYFPDKTWRSENSEGGFFQFIPDYWMPLPEPPSDVDESK